MSVLLDIKSEIRLVGSVGSAFETRNHLSVPTRLCDLLITGSLHQIKIHTLPFQDSPSCLPRLDRGPRWEGVWWDKEPIDRRRRTMPFHTCFRATNQGGWQFTQPTLPHHLISRALPSPQRIVNILTSSAFRISLAVYCCWHRPSGLSHCNVYYLPNFS